MIKVYENDKIIGEVEYNDNLDWWDGSNNTCGSVGRHKGLTQLEDDRYVLINGTQFQNEHDYAEIISADQAVQEILDSKNDELFIDFPELGKLKEKIIIKEKKR